MDRYTRQQLNTGIGTYTQERTLVYELAESRVDRFLTATISDHVNGELVGSCDPGQDVEWL